MSVRQPGMPVRIRSASGYPPEPSQFLRSCRTCKASFWGLAAGRTGERGLWTEQGWFCSVECWPADRRGIVLCADQKDCPGRAIHCGCPPEPEDHG